MSQNVLTAAKHLRVKKVILRSLLFFLLAALFFIGVFSALFLLDGLKIKTVRVDGVKILSDEEVSKEVGNVLSGKAWWFIPKNRIFSFSEKEISTGLFQKFPRLKNVSTETDWPSTISLFVEEREPVALLCQAEKRRCFYLDKESFIFENAPFFSSGVFLKFFDLRQQDFSAGQFWLDKKLFAEILSFKERVERSMAVEEVYITKENNLEFHAAEGWYLVLGLNDALEESYNNFMVFLEEVLNKDTAVSKNIEYVDLRFGNKVYYKKK